MRALVIYESMYGNTQRVAESIASGLGPQVDAIAIEVGAAPSLAEVPFDLLVNGEPTHVLRMSRRDSRKGAANDSDRSVISAEIGIRDWNAAQKEHAVRVPAATFGTRLKMSRRLTGSAAHNAEKKLRKHGFEMIASTESFFVEGETGPLHAGEEERAHQWGETLTVKLVTAH
ncbi:MAG: flavodoxin [Acidimicrobiia bacterium]